MRRVEEREGAERAILVVAPGIGRARAATRALGCRWGKRRLTAASWPDLFRTRQISCVLLCPQGENLEDDLDFLHRALARLLWPAPDGDLQAAIAGLRGEHPPPVARGSPMAAGLDRKSALLMEGAVTPARVRAALTSRRRHWIVESPFRVRLTDRHLDELDRQGVRWSTLEPVRIAGLIASPALAGARKQWRYLLPRTKVKVLKPSSVKRRK